MFARGSFTFVGFRFRRPDPERKFKILAEIADVLFQHRFGPALAALLGHPRVVVRAIQADAQVGPAFHAGFAAAGLAVQRPRFAAVVAMTVHSSAFRVQCWKSNRFLQL